MKIIFLLSAALSLVAACTPALANKHNLVTSDCGVNWRTIPAGSSLPQGMSKCEYAISLPNSPMVGSSKFKAFFQGKVGAYFEISYEYIITDPLNFINGAKYLARNNSVDGGDTGQFETAENTIIDVRFREQTSSDMPAQNIVDFDPGAYEAQLQEKINQALKDRGLQILSLALVFDAGEQTKQAMDSIAAVRVYDTMGIKELGQEMMVARAGAPNIVVNDKAN